MDADLYLLPLYRTRHTRGQRLALGGQGGTWLAQRGGWRLGNFAPRVHVGVSREWHRARAIAGAARQNWYVL